METPRQVVHDFFVDHGCSVVDADRLADGVLELRRRGHVGDYVQGSGDWIRAALTLAEIAGHMKPC